MRIKTFSKFIFFIENSPKKIIIKKANLKKYFIDLLISPVIKEKGEDNDSTKY